MRFTAKDKNVTSLTVNFTGGGTRTLTQSQLQAGFAARNKLEAQDLAQDDRLEVMEEKPASDRSSSDAADNSKENE